MFKQNRLALLKAVRFCKGNLKFITLLILIISVIANINFILGMFLLVSMLGSLAFFLRDTELISEIKVKKELNFVNLKNYILYGLSFGILFSVVVILIFLIIFLFAGFITFIFYILNIYRLENSSFPIYFILSFIIAFFIVMLLLIPFHILLPRYINFILSSITPKEVLKINKNILTKMFWRETFDYITKKEYIFLSSIWISISFLLIGLTFLTLLLYRQGLLFIFEYIPVYPKIFNIILNTSSTFILYYVICFTFIYLIYLSNIIKRRIMAH